MELVEDHDADTRQVTVVLQPPGEHALGHHLDACSGPDDALVAGRVPDGVTDVLAEQRSHAAGRGSGGETPWFEQQDATAGQPGLVEQADRDDRRLAGAWWGHQDGPARIVEGPAELGYGRLDRQPAVGQGHRGRGAALS